MENVLSKSISNISWYRCSDLPTIGSGTYWGRWARGSTKPPPNSPHLTWLYLGSLLVLWSVWSAIKDIEGVSHFRMGVCLCRGLPLSAPFSTWSTWPTRKKLLRSHLLSILRQRYSDSSHSRSSSQLFLFPQDVGACASAAPDGPDSRRPETG